MIQEIWQPIETLGDELQTLRAQVQDESSGVTQRLSALAQETVRQQATLAQWEEKLDGIEQRLELSK